ncbi:S-layer homology domain-containing protein [Paenibacillus whitsoniae]|uniref:S-layer homology domain-containing protein n=1 Tax=Paenibacillus whitsoniae TaxID=2496558 RepID=UPI0013DECDD7|nr:S-layer homology domain-containing protein [Paenibacillus whitsoniae]
MRKRKLLALLQMTVLSVGLFSGLLPTPGVQADSGTTYYIDATGGSDSNVGTSEGQAWKSLEKVNATTFQPGDHIAFKSGEVWTGQLWPKGSGTAGLPIVIDQYGSGAKPAIQGQGLVADAVRLFNQEYWEIHNLDVSNQKPATATPGENLDDYRGIHISGDNSTTLDYFRIVAVNVHDVTGEINWISGTQPNPPQPGIRFKTGWDGSKKTGGIVFDTTVPNIFNPPSQATVINDVVIEKSSISNTSFAGIVFKQYTGDGKDANGNTIATSTGWGERANGTDPKFTPHTNIVIRNNYITQKDTAYGCNAMYLTDIRGGLVERNVVYRAGTSGIEMYYADDIVVQHNEVYETTQKAGGADSNGIDPDKATTKILIQYNYIHDNGDGILICQFSFGDTIIRNNVIKSNTRYPIYLHSDKKAVAEVYNNTIYNDKSNYLIYGYGTSLDATYNIRNNNLYTTRAGATITTSGTTFYENNNYYGSNLLIPAVDTKAMQADPKFVSTVSGPSGTAETGPQLDSALGFRSQSGSGLINAGLAMPNNGGKDYAGKALYNGLPDIGAFEYYTPDGATTESVNGKIRDGAGKAIAGAKVSLQVGGTPYSATTDAKGAYVIANVPLAVGVELKAEKAGYLTATDTISIQPPNMTTKDLTITSTSPYGSLKGSILDEKMDGLPNVAVSVLYGDDPVASGVTDSTGNLTMAQVPIGDGYTVTLSKAGYFPVSKSNVTITPESLTDIGKVLLSSKQPQVLFNHTFNTLATGTMTSGNNLTVSASGGSVVVEEVPSAQDKSVKLTRSSNSGNTSLAQSFATPLKGIVTIEADLKRNDTYSTGNNWFSLPYVYGTSPTPANPGLSFAFDKGKVKAYVGTASTEFMSYTVGKWYNMRMVIDTAAQTYDLYFNGQKIVDHSGFRQSMTDITKIDFYANSSNYGSVSVDNVRITQGIGYSKMDATLADVASSAGAVAKLDDTHYAVQVASDVTSLTLTPTAGSPNAKSITVAGTPVASGTASVPIVLTDDQTDVPVVVTAEDGQTTAAYTVTVNRISPLMDASLRSLIVSGGALSPDFDKDVTDYEVTVPYEVSEVTVTPTAGVESADITVDGTGVTSGTPSAPIALLEGDNMITVYVVSPDGTSNQTYTITVHRGQNPYGAVSGTIRDQGGQLVYGAAVVLRAADAVYQTSSDVNGHFTFEELRPDTAYRITANKAGYNEAVLESVTVTSGQTATVGDLTLTAQGTVAGLSGVSTATVGQALQSSFSLSNVSESVYSAVYGIALTIHFDPAKLQWGSAAPQLPQLELVNVVQTGADTIQLQAAMTGGNESIPANIGLFALNWTVTAGAQAGETAIALSQAELINPWGDRFPATTLEHALVITVPSTPDPDPNPDPGHPDPGNPGTTDPTPSDSGSSDSDDDVPATPNPGTSADPARIELHAGDQGSAALTASELNQAFASAKPDAQGGKTVSIVVNGNPSSSRQTGLQVPVAALQADARGNRLSVQTELGSLQLPTQMLKGLSVPSETVEIRLTRISEIDNHPVIDLQLFSDGAPLAWANADAPVTVAMPYTPTAEERLHPERIAVFYLDPQGAVIPVSNGHWDAGTGQVVFTVKHFSQYAVKFGRPAFTDLASVSWAQSAIETLAAKGVIEGRSAQSFDPASRITRADFVVLLMRALELAAGKPTASFADVTSSDYYYTAIAAAQSYGIATGGSDNRFEPEQAITREDTMVLTTRALEHLKRLPGGVQTSSALAPMKDAAELSAYAVQSVAALVAAGIVQGDESGLHPKQTLTRAEAAVMIQRLLSTK